MSETAVKERPILMSAPMVLAILTDDELADKIHEMRRLAMLEGLNTLDWIIVGGESGAGARPMNVDWARSILSECKRTKVAFFMKQLGGVYDKRHDIDQFPVDLRVRQFPEVLAR